MKITNVRYALDQGSYPFLALSIDGRSASVGWEQKPTLTRHGIVSLTGPGSEALTARLGGALIRNATDDPRIFWLAVAFGLEVYHGRFEVGAATVRFDPDEVAELGDRLEKFALPGAPTWVEVFERVREAIRGQGV